MKAKIIITGSLESAFHLLNQIELNTYFQKKEIHAGWVLSYLTREQAWTTFSKVVKKLKINRDEIQVTGNKLCFESALMQLK